MNGICKDILELIDNKLIPSAKSPEESIFYNEMKGDFYRYMFEYTKGD
jgi:14-3-3 protein epsilon